MSRLNTHDKYNSIFIVATGALLYMMDHCSPK